MIRNNYYKKISGRHTGKQTRMALPLFVFSILLFFIAFALKYFSTSFPEIVEKYYSLRFYRTVSGFFSKYFYLFPFSCAEILLYCVIIFGIFLFALIIINIFKRKFSHSLRITAFVLCIISSAYFLLTVMWGLNYNRQPLEKSLGYKTGAPTSEELSRVMSHEAQSINSLCDKVKYDVNGHSYYPGGFSKISENVNNGYTVLSEKGGTQGTLFGGARPRPKGILASKLLSYTGIGGIFVPFTFEPNVDTDIPQFVIPFNAAHESAHFKGFAREQEANFVAYLADTANSDPYFQYSAHMEAYIYVSNALYDTDNEQWNKVMPKIDRRAAADFEYYSDYINAHLSKVTDISNKVNDSYLKSQGQCGVVTYDIFVTLLVEKYRE